MRLLGITANRHIYDGMANGKPLRLLLAFDGNRRLRLSVAGDGERMIIDGEPLENPVDLDECGRIDVADVTRLLFPMLDGLEVAAIHALTLRDRWVGARLDAEGGGCFNFWADGDELHWGDEGAFLSHDWLNGEVPRPSERL